MAKLNKTVKTPAYTETFHKNYMDGNSWDISNPFFKLRMVAASSFFGEPKYYNEDGTINSNLFKDEYKDEDDLKYLVKSLGEPIFKPQDEIEVQKQFEKLLVMQYENIKLTVGLQRSNQDLVQYCITIPQTSVQNKATNSEE